MTQNVKVAIDGSLFISANCELNGTTWNRVDITKTAEVLMLDINGKLKRFRASAGDNPIASWDLLNGIVINDTGGNFPPPQQNLTDGENISWDMNGGGCGIVILGGNRTLSNPTNTTSGVVYKLIVKQDATGSRTLAFGSYYKFPGGVVVTLSSTANAIDIFEFFAETGSVLHCINFIADSK